MTFDPTKITAAIEKAATTTDMTQAKSGGGGEYTPPAAGPCRLRLVGYIELGKQLEKFQGKPREREKVKLIFELSGKNHAPKEIDGKKYPYLIEVTETLSLNEKANFFKLFQRLNHGQQFKHMAQLLGKSMLGEVVHREYEVNGQKRIAAELKRKGDGYTIKPPYVLNPETDETIRVEAGPQISPTRCFLWDHADLDQWASIFIEGEYEERKDDKGNVVAPAKSKNKFQLLIRSALNFDGSPIDTLLKANGVKLDLPAPGAMDDEVPAEDDTPAAPQQPTGDALAGGAAKATTKPARGPAADLDDDIPF